MGAEIIGRRDELLALESFLEAAPAGGQSLLMEGAAGIGKTVLWQDALRIAVKRDFCVLRSRPTQSEAQVAFAAVGDLLAPALGGALQRLAPVQRLALETALLMRDPDERFPDTRALGLVLLALIRALAQERPVLVALDDAQWLDASSAQVLTFMLRRLDGDPVAVLATVRGRPVTLPLELDRIFAELRLLPITPLSVGAIHRLLWGRLGIALPRPVIVRVHDITAGNPFHGGPAFDALEIYDRVGGGDSFASGLIHGLLCDRDVPAALAFGVANGALAMTTPGDTSMATLAEVERLMSGAAPRVVR
jgi:predicted ATPase